MITKRWKGYVLYLLHMKYKSITVYVKNKTGKQTLHFKYVLKE